MQQEENGEAPVLNALVDRLISMGSGSEESETEEVSRVLSRLVISLMNAGTGGSASSIGGQQQQRQQEERRREAALPLINRLVRLWLSLGKGKLAHNLARALDSGGSPPLRNREYAFYRGRLALMAGQHAEALSWLELSASLTKPIRLPSPSRRAIYAALIPLRLAKGLLPNRAWLPELGLQEEYGGLVEAYRRADYPAFTSQLEKHRGFLVKHQVFLLCHTLLLPRLLRNLIKTIAIVCNPPDARLPLAFIQAGLRLRGLPWYSSPSQIEYQLALLIQAGLIKGYLSHDKATLVVSKRNAFPRLDSLL